MPRVVPARPPIGHRAAVHIPDRGGEPLRTRRQHGPHRVRAPEVGVEEEEAVPDLHQETDVCVGDMYK